jgi:glycosyltransferase 2 family protein
VALRKAAGVTDTARVLASILVEAALSAISGVLVFVISLAWVKGVDAPLLPLVAFALLCVIGIHPRVFRPLAENLLRPFSGSASIEPLPFPLMIVLLLFYCGTWLIGGVAVYFMLRSVGSDPGLATIPYLGGVSAVGAIVAVLAFFVPSGLGAREASMYGLLLAITTAGPALSVTLINRLAITLVEVVLFGVGVVTWRSVPRPELE